MTSLRVPRAEHQEQGAAVAATCAHHRGGSRRCRTGFIPGTVLAAIPMRNAALKAQLRQLPTAAD
jgi:hypothetical protein